MSVTLAHNQYRKADTRVVRVGRDPDLHDIVDDAMSVAFDLGQGWSR
jgi:hypothetical protein